jgi:hypothetical protein
MALRRVLKEPQRSEALSRSNFKYREELPRRPSALAAAVVNAALGRGAPGGRRVLARERLRAALAAALNPAGPLHNCGSETALTIAASSPRPPATGEFTYALGEDGKEFKESPANEFVSDPSMAKKKVSRPRPLRSPPLGSRAALLTAQPPSHPTRDPPGAAPFLRAVTCERAGDEVARGRPAREQQIAPSTQPAPFSRATAAAGSRRNP